MDDQTVIPRTAPSAGPENAPGPDPTHYVGIGASAGGLEAIEAFFLQAPVDAGFTYIVVQHLSPDYKSLMVELLSKRTRMPVYRAGDGMRAAPDTVYIIPPKKNLTIFHGTLLLGEQDHSRGINLPIDIFLRSLAEDMGERAVGVILSGTGSDGMRGVRAIKEHGGMVMVQEESTAKFDGMPRAAISTGLADFILPPEEMPAQLISYTEHPYVLKAERSDTLLTDEDRLTRIFAILRDRCKVDFTYYKPSTVHRRIERRMSVNGVEDIGAYVSCLQQRPGEAMALYRELLIGVTNFFRDEAVFQLLAANVLPELLEQYGTRPLRFWVPGCSTGEEAYTLAILARESMERSGRRADIKIFATDIDRDAILQAGNGVYPESIAADLSPDLLTRYFFRKEDSFQVSRTIRQMVVFAQHNLIKDPPFTNIGLISCRNLLIYLQTVLQKKVLELFNFSLNPDGVLMLGTSETTGDMGDYFEPVHRKFKIYRSRGKHRRIPNEGGSVPMVPGRGRGRSVPVRADRDRRGTDREPILERLLEVLGEGILPLTLLVNEEMALLHVFGNTEGFLKLPSGRMVNNVLKMVARELEIPLSAGIQKSFRTGASLTYSNLRIQSKEGLRIVRMRIHPLPHLKGHPPLVTVVLDQPGEDAVASESVPAGWDPDGETREYIRNLEGELQFTRENLQATIEELETANEELQATNEELLASNEELQSTNQELQSTNEELHTVNAEYQDRIIELTELHNDVDNLLTHSQIGKLFLDENMEIRRFSPDVTRIFHIAENDEGRPLAELDHCLAGVDPVATVQRVLSSVETVEEEVQTRDGRWYLMRVLPYQVGPEVFSGAVMTFIDISQVKSAQAALAESEADLKRTARLARMGSWEYRPENGEHRWSEETFHIHELAPGPTPKPEEGIRYYAPQWRPVITRAFQEACDHGIPYDLMLEIITAKGNRRWVRAIGQPEVADGKVVRICGAFQDIDEQKRADDVLKQQEAMLGAIFRAAPVGIGLVKERVIHQVNETLCQMTGYAAEELLGQSSRILYPSEEDFRYVGEEKYRQLREKGTGTVQTRWRTREGRVIDVLLSSAPINPEDASEGVTFTALEITHRQQAETLLPENR